MQGEFRADGRGVMLHVEVSWRSFQAFVKAAIATALAMVALYSTPAFQDLLSFLGQGM